MQNANDPPAGDAELIARSVQESEVFAAVFDRHVGAILRYVHARLGADLAEDVVAETFLIAFRKRARYDPAQPDAAPWLFGIATREIGRHRRAEARRQQALRRHRPEPAAEFTAQADDRASAERLRPRLAAALAGLRRDERDLLLLIAWAGLTYEQAAAALDLPVGTVRSRLSRLRAKLRADLGDQAEGLFDTQLENHHG